MVLARGSGRCLRANPSKDGDAEPRGYHGNLRTPAGPPAHRLSSIAAARPCYRSRLDLIIAAQSKTAERRGRRATGLPRRNAATPAGPPASTSHLALAARFFQ